MWIYKTSFRPNLPFTSPDFRLWFEVDIFPFPSPSLSPSPPGHTSSEGGYTESYSTYKVYSSTFVAPLKNTMADFADDQGTSAAAATANGDQAPAPALAPGAREGGAVGEDLEVLPLRTATGGAGGAGMAGRKQMANILCCLCGRSIQPNGETEMIRRCSRPVAITAEDRRV